MSRADRKARYNSATASDAQDANAVRLFAFTNFADGYRSAVAPEAPFMVVRAKQAKLGDAHPTLQWAPFANAVYSDNPATEAVFMIDGSQLGDHVESDEASAGPTTYGVLARSVMKAVVKLNPRRAVVVGAGPTAWLLVKMLAVSFNGADELIRSALILLPSKPTAEVETTVRRVAQKAPGANGFKFKLFVVGGAAEDVLGWKELCTVFDVVHHPQAAGESVFVTASRFVHTSEFRAGAGGSGAAAAAVQTTSGNRKQTVATYHVVLVRSPYSKQLEQRSELADLSPVGESRTANTSAPGQNGESDDEDDSVDSADGDRDVAEALRPSRANRPENVSTTAPLIPPSDYPNVGAVELLVQGIVLRDKRIGNAHGIISFHPDTLPETLNPYLDNPVVLTATVGHVDGHQCLVNPRGFTRLPAAKIKHGAYLCRADAIPPVNHSALRRFYGCLVVRGRKCALVRSLTGAYAGLRFPYLPIESPYTALETALRAACLQLDVPPDTFAVSTVLPTVTYYPSDGHSVITLYIAFATHRPPGGAARDEIEEDLTPDDPYDWLTVQQAKDELNTQPERDALDDVVRTVRRAVAAKALTVPVAGLGTLGDAGVRPSTLVAFVHAPAAQGLAETRSIAETLAKSSNSSTLGAEVVVLAPEAEDRCPTKRRKATVKAVEERLKGARNTVLLVPVAPNADLDLLQYELAPAIADKTWSLTRLITAFHAQRVPMVPCSDGPLPGSLGGETLTTHALASLEQCDLAVYIEPVAAASTDVFSPADFDAVVRGLNRAAAVAIGLLHASTMLGPAGDMRALTNFRQGESAAKFTVLQFNKAGPGTVPLFTKRVQQQLLQQPEGAASLLRCRVVHLTGSVWLSTRNERQADLRSAGGRVTAHKGPRWATGPSHALRVVIDSAGADAIRQVEALLSELACHSTEEAQQQGDDLGWVDNSDEDDDG
jgi:hypothetical protein